MQQADLFLAFTQPFEKAGLRYMVTGSVASMVYGEPRLTNDIDIVLEVSGDLINRQELARWFETQRLDAEWSKVKCDG